MAVNEFLVELDQASKTVLNSSFKIEVYDTKTVPRFDDGLLTFDNLDDCVKKCKRLESCVLYVDIRDSAAISAESHPWSLARLYSAFVRDMIKAAKLYNGHIRNIIGDRVMVVYDQQKCYTNAVNTAILMNSIGQYIIDKHYAGSFKCGIGIDYGKMLVTKAGEIRRGEETEFYRSLVWLGRPANVASRLTDIAHKTFRSSRPMVSVGRFRPFQQGFYWNDQTYEAFLGSLEATNSPVLRYKDKAFRTFQMVERVSDRKHAPILMTEEVFNGFRAENPTARSVVEGWWKQQLSPVKEYTGKVYGGNIHLTAVEDL